MSRRDRIASLQAQIDREYAECPHGVLVATYQKRVLSLKCRECGKHMSSLSGGAAEHINPVTYFQPSYPNSVIEHDPPDRPSSPPEHRSSSPR